MSWAPFDGGARITLEKSASAAPFTITCGIYGWAMHTRFFSDANSARVQYEAMKTALASIVDGIPLESDPDLAEKMKAVRQAIQRFVAEYP